MTPDIDTRIERFLACDRFAVVGASADRGKYGNKVLRAYLQHGREVVAINPRGGEIEGVPAYPRLTDCPEPIDAVSIITPPEITATVLEEIIELGIEHVWLQPGAETEAIVDRAEQESRSIIAGGPCLLVVLGFREG